ncbi:MAG: integrase, partial [candidate division KSB1 bacterium]|nr:integrase [candidate division KSB1 bacterium]
MSKKSVQEYLRAILQRYRYASKTLKKTLLDEFCEICGCHRKHAIRRLNQALNKNKRTKNSGRRRKPGRPRKYEHPELLEVLERIWRYMNLPCAKRL